MKIIPRPKNKGKRFTVRRIVLVMNFVVVRLVISQRYVMHYYKLFCLLLTHSSTMFFFSSQVNSATGKQRSNSVDDLDSGKESPGSERVLTIVETPEHVPASQEIEAVAPFSGEKEKKREKRKRKSLEKGRVKKKKKTRKSSSAVAVTNVRFISMEEITSKICKNESPMKSPSKNAPKKDAESQNGGSSQCNGHSSEATSPPETQRSHSGNTGVSPCSQEVMRIETQSRMKNLGKHRRISFTTIPISPSKLGESPLPNTTTPSPHPTSLSTRTSTDSPETFAVAQTLLDLSNGSNKATEST